MTPPGDEPALAVVVVAYDSAGDLPALAASLVGELRPGDELVIVDNASTDDSAAIARTLPGNPLVVELGQNGGFAAGCHAGVRASTAPLLLFLNPDATPEPGAVHLMRAVASTHPDWAAWQAAVMLPGDHVNSGGGVVHFTGIGWPKHSSAPAAALPAVPVETPFPSGAAMVVRRRDWDAVGGLDASYFLYGEDLELGLRLWLTGRRVGIEPRARFVHGYAFDKGAGKWFWLERNRWRTVLAVYPLPLLLLVLPALLAAEPALLVVAAAGGWLRPKLRAQGAVLRGLPDTLRKRRAVQATRTISAFDFAAQLTAPLDSPYLAAANRPAITGPLRAYWALVRAVLAIIGRRRSSPSTSRTARPRRPPAP